MGLFQGAGGYNLFTVKELFFTTNRLLSLFHAIIFIEVKHD